MFVGSLIVSSTTFSHARTELWRGDYGNIQPVVMDRRNGACLTNWKARGSNGNHYSIGVGLSAYHEALIFSYYNSSVRRYRGNPNKLFIRFDNEDGRLATMSPGVNPANGAGYLFFEVLIEEPWTIDFGRNFAFTETVTVKYKNDVLVLNTPNAYETLRAVYDCYRFFGGSWEQQ